MEKCMQYFYPLDRREKYNSLILELDIIFIMLLNYKSFNFVLQVLKLVVF